MPNLATISKVNENAGALARPPATCPPCHYSKQKVLLTVIFLVCRKFVIVHTEELNVHIYINRNSKITFFNMATLTFDL